MDRNLLLAVTLSVAVYAAWFGFFEKNLNPPIIETTASLPAIVSGMAPPQFLNIPPAGKVEFLLADAATVEIGDALAKIHPRGATIVSYQSPEPLGRVELVHNPEDGLFPTFTELEFKRDLLVTNGIVYSATRSDGLQISKEYLPGAGTLLPRIRLLAVNPTKRALDTGVWTLTVGPGLGTIATEEKENKNLQRAIALTPLSAGLNGHIDENLKPGEYKGPYRWIGVDNRYFLVALFPPAELFEPVKITEPAKVILTAKSVNILPHGAFTWVMPFYIGAKGHTWLSRYNLGLERSIDFGFFSWIGRKMLEALESLHGLTGNWGWAIFLLTLILQALLFPLTWKSLRAAAQMKKLQPEIAKIQQKYANDSAKLSAATLELYKMKGANPLGGCLPMVLQMPIFIALFNTLRNSWELHGAAWIFWIRDLSAKDPYYVLPVVMGGIMFLQSKMNPPVGDPAQQKVMMFMPLIFTFMFMNFPSGLVLYWLTNSLVSAAAQIALKDRLEA